MKEMKHGMSRRGFLGSMAAVAATAAVAPSMVACGSEKASAVSTAVTNALRTADGKPNSKFNGVQIGCSTYGFLRSASTIDEVIKCCIDANVSSIELRHDLESGLEGCPVKPNIQRGGGISQEALRAMMGGNIPSDIQAMVNAAARSGQGQRQQREMTPEEKAAQDKYNAEIRVFRSDPATMEKWAAVRKKFNDAGIDIHELKWMAGDSDEDIDYTCQVCKVLGAGGFT